MEERQASLPTTGRTRVAHLRLSPRHLLLAEPRENLGQGFSGWVQKMHLGAADIGWWSMSKGILKADTNLRDGPGHYESIRAMVGKNRSLEILDKRSKWPWVKVRVLSGDYSGLVGWMHSENIDIDR